MRLMRPMARHILLINLFLVFLTGMAYGQVDKVDNLPNFDNKWVHFGFSLGISNNGFVLDQDLTQVDSLISLEVGRQPGFDINVVSELHLGKYFGLRFTPGIAFLARNLEYSYFTPSGPSSVVTTKTIESTFVNFPLLLKYRSQRLNNFATYVLLGFKYSLDLAAQENVDNTVDERGESIVKLQKDNYNLEVGVGLDFFLEYFKFSPELKFTLGLNNVIVKDGTQFSDPINRLSSRIFVLSFNFEG